MDDDEGTGDDTSGPSSNSGNNSNNSNAVDTGMMMECFFHCFDGPGATFPYTLTPLDEDGDPNNVLLACQRPNGTTMSLTNTTFMVDASRCASQVVAQEVMDLAICDSGAIPQPPSDEWKTWATDYARQQQRDCVTALNAAGCHPSPPNANGSEQICSYFLEYPMRYDLLESTPEFEEIDPEMYETEDCDFDAMLECGGGDSSGGGVLPFGQVSTLVSCNPTFTSCTFHDELKDLILINTHRMFDDGVRFKALQSGQVGYPGMKIVLPNVTPDSDSEKLFYAFGFHNGDVVRTANGINLTDADSLWRAFQTLFDTGTTTAKVYRNGVLLRIQAFEVN